MSSAESRDFAVGAGAGDAAELGVSCWLGGFGGGEQVFVEFVAGAETGEDDFDWFRVGCCGRLRFGDQFFGEVEDFDGGVEFGDEEGAASSSAACGEDQIGRFVE